MSAPAASPADRAPRAPRAARWLPGAVLALSLALTALAVVVAVRTADAFDRARFDRSVAAAEDRVEHRLDTYLALLLSARGFVAASEEVTPDEFGRYAAQLDLPGRYPGIQGIGVSARVPAADVPRVEARMAARGRAGFRVWPAAPARDDYHAIVFLEPLDRRNRAAIGYDMFSEPVRRAAMARARDTGLPAASDRVTLVQEIDPDKQAGFLIYVPVYRGGAFPATVEARRDALLGFVYSPFRAGDFFARLFGREALPNLAFTVEDPEPPVRGALLYRSERPDPAYRPRFEAARTLVVAGRPWRLTFRTQPSFEAVSAQRFAAPIGLVGFAFSLVLFAASRAQVRARQRVEALAEDLQRAVRVRDDFLSIAGHELRTPLAALALQVQGLHRLAQKGGLTADPAALGARLGKVVEHVGRLGRLVDELLDVSRIAAGRLTLHAEPMDLAAVAREVVERFAEQAARARTPVALRAEAPVEGQWDRPRVDQVLTNLLSNALKYGRGKPVEVAVERCPAVARVTVRDHGIGIAPEDRDRIFGRFERAVSDRHYGGLGLGLWITRQVVEAQGGRIRVESAPDEGSVFVVELPLAERAQ